MLNTETGVLTGRISKRGKYPVTIQAEAGRSAIRFQIDLICGDEILLTPPMGWNSWYCFSENADQSRIRDVAQAMRDRGLAAHGYNFVNIDDCWQGERGGKYFGIQGNEKFPDMQELGDFIHSLGLRFGLYSTPWLCSYAGFRGGSMDGGYELRAELPLSERLQPSQLYGRFPGGGKQNVWRTGPEWMVGRDAKQWSDWGVDYVKMDWHPNDVATTRRIALDLRDCDRDIVLSLSNNAPVFWGDELLNWCQVIRTSGDITDHWESIVNNGFNRDPYWSQQARPGHWPDSDMLQIGAIGVPNQMNTTYKKSELTYEEQISHFSYWCLSSSPLLLSCDIAGMDDETFDILTNDDMLAIDQDSLAARLTGTELKDGVCMFRKPLADGGEAVGIFNLNDKKTNCRLDLGKTGKDLWSKETVELCDDFKFMPHTCRIFRSK